jgi:hypothetical protein
MRKTALDEFEQLLKNSADELRMHPAQQVWKNVRSRMHPRKRLYVAAAVLLFLLSAGYTAFQLQETSNPGTSAGVPNTSGQQPANMQLTNNEVNASNSTMLNPSISNNGRASAINFNNTTPAPEKKPKPKYNTTNKPAGETLTAANTPSEITTETTYPPVNETIVRTEETGTKPQIENSGTAPGSNQSFIENQRTEIKNQATGIEYPVIAEPDNTGRHPVAANNNPEKENSKPAPAENIANEINIGKPRTRQLKNPLLNEEPVPLNELNKTEGVAVKPKQRRFTTEFYFSPSISYRKLSDSRDKNDPGAFTQDELDKAVFHKPSIGMEAGVNWLFRVDDRLRVKTGFQINYNRFNMKASRVPQAEIATIVLYGNNQDLNNSSNLRANDKNLVPEWLENKNLQISIPLGIEASLASSSTGTTSLNMGITAQPSYLLRDNNYLLSTDLKNYTTAPSLTRRFNVNIGMEAFFSFNQGNLRWHFGPQLRYQLFSTYNKIYPIRENLLDYGFKIGISKPF